MVLDPHVRYAKGSEIMQATRERILKILKERGQATVKELSEMLGLTTVTIRHHLDTLRREDLVAAPSVRHRKAPGRPQHVYTLTQEASDFFPKRYERLIDLMVEEVRSRFSNDEVERMMERIGKRIADGVTIPQSADLEERVVVAVNFMDERGYMADWERTEDGDYLIHVANCPYEGVSRRHSEVCKIDQTLLGELLGPVSDEINRTSSPPHHCTYVIKPA
jgi:predicted ArsR family transcriptional regulator